MYSLLKDKDEDMSVIQKSGFSFKHCCITLISVTVCFIGVRLGAEALRSIYYYEMSIPEMFDGIAIRTFARWLIFIIATGAMYSVLSNIGSMRKYKFKLHLNARRFLFWVLPCGLLALWHVLWILLPNTIEVPFPIYTSGSGNYSHPPFRTILLFILGYTLVKSFIQRDAKTLSILHPALFFILSIITVIIFQWLDGTRSPFYNLTGYFVVFAVYGSIGAFFGFTYYLSGGFLKKEVWGVDWCKLVIWCASSLAVVFYEGVTRLDIEEIGRMSDISLFYMFIFGNSIITSFMTDRNVEVENIVLSKKE